MKVYTKGVLDADDVALICRALTYYIEKESLPPPLDGKSTFGADFYRLRDDLKRVDVVSTDW